MSIFISKKLLHHRHLSIVSADTMEKTKHKTQDLPMISTAHPWNGFL